MIPRAIDVDISPLLVSDVIAVVSVRVSESPSPIPPTLPVRAMLPPTMRMAPTSARALPSPANTAVMMPNLASFNVATAATLWFSQLRWVP